MILKNGGIEMKKRTYVYSSLFSIFLLLMVPNVSTIEYSTVESVIKEKITENREIQTKNVFNKLFFQFVQ
jgi:hypothetical protein